MMVAEDVSQGATEMVVHTQPVVLLLSETCHFYSSRLPKFSLQEALYPGIRIDFGRLHPDPDPGVQN
jgi:hypothetical protein